MRVYECLYYLFLLAAGQSQTVRQRIQQVSNIFTAFGIMNLVFRHSFLRKCSFKVEEAAPAVLEEFER